MTNFKIGDKVRINNVDGIGFGFIYFKNGMETEVLDTDWNGIYLATKNHKPGDNGLVITNDELHCVEKVEKPLTFTEGDFLRINNVDKIMFGDEHFSNGDVAMVVGNLLSDKDSPRVKSVKKPGKLLTIAPWEMEHVEKASEPVPGATNGFLSSKYGPGKEDNNPLGLETGDKVRILDVDKITTAPGRFKTGEIVEVRVDEDNDVFLVTIDGPGVILYNHENEFIEKVTTVDVVEEEAYYEDAKELGVVSGDRVRILNARAIMFSGDKFGNGDVLEVTVRDGEVFLRYEGDSQGLYLHRDEFHAVEVVKEGEVPTQAPMACCGQVRIKELEERVEALEVEVAASRKPTPMPMAIPEYQSSGFRLLASGNITITSDQGRKEAIELAQKIIEEETALTERTIGGSDGMSYGIFVVVPKFEVDTKKRTVKVDLLGATVPSVYATGVAKCDPSDVFNEDIGKAIAILRAKGKSIPEKLLKAPNPSSYKVGQRIIGGPSAFTTARGKESTIVDTGLDGYFTDAYNTGREDKLTWIGPRSIERILEDTGVEY